MGPRAAAHLLMPLVQLLSLLFELLLERLHLLRGRTSRGVARRFCPVRRCRRRLLCGGLLAAVRGRRGRERAQID